mmetsp:Transcript_60822/g.94570  ORF Transcript_60822/g.94570 Transcript_60822/m.94570 type:complete len:217 (-) Transcript_60822:21-671(-)
MGCSSPRVDVIGALHVNCSCFFTSSTSISSFAGFNCFICDFGSSVNISFSVHCMPSRCVPTLTTSLRRSAMNCSLLLPLRYCTKRTPAWDATVSLPARSLRNFANHGCCELILLTICSTSRKRNGVGFFINSHAFSATAPTSGLRLLGLPLELAVLSAADALTGESTVVETLPFMMKLPSSFKVTEAPVIGISSSTTLPPMLKCSVILSAVNCANL